MAKCNLLLCSSVVGLVLALAATAGASPRTLERGFAHDGPFRTGSDSERARAFELARAAGGRWLRLQAVWSQIAPAGSRKPPDFRASDPADARYAWSELDRVVRETHSYGFEPIINVVFAPRWAEGPGRPRSDGTIRPGTWVPSPLELNRFLRAAARRYSGSFADPANPQERLPRVRYWQPWNEPNLWPFLEPQWVRRDGSWRPFAPQHYAKMLNAAYSAVKAVHDSNRLVMAGLGPFGSAAPARAGRVRPAHFLRELFCLDARLARKRCRDRPHLDVYAHHPYSRGGPRRRALNADDATFPELRSLDRIFRAAERARTSLPSRRKPFWVTEMGWDSNPPDPDAVSTARQAQWLNEAYYVMWKAGIGVAINLQLVDAPIRKPRPGFVATQAGIFFRGRTIFQAAPKPSLSAFRFPFVVDGEAKRAKLAWGVSPCTCSIAIEQRAGGRWSPLATLAGSSGRVFRRRLSSSTRGPFRAVTGDPRLSSLEVRPKDL